MPCIVRTARPGKPRAHIQYEDYRRGGPRLRYCTVRAQRAGAGPDARVRYGGTGAYRSAWDAAGGVGGDDG